MHVLNQESGLLCQKNGKVGNEKKFMWIKGKKVCDALCHGNGKRQV